jgi:hypothetical protein
MTTRLNLLPDPRFEALQRDLHGLLQAAAELVDRATFGDLFDPLMRATLQIGFAGAGAHEGTVWLVDRAQENLVPVFNTGPDAETFLRDVRGQPLSSGLISGVFRREQAFCENHVHRHAQHDKSVDRAVGLVTAAMIAVPFYFAQRIRGVVSCVQLVAPDAPAADEPPGFSLESLGYVRHASEVLTRLVDHALLGALVGWSAT